MTLDALLAYSLVVLFFIGIVALVLLVPIRADATERTGVGAEHAEMKIATINAATKGNRVAYAITAVLFVLVIVATFFSTRIHAQTSSS